MQECSGEIAANDPAGGDGDKGESRGGNGRCIGGRGRWGLDEPMAEFLEVRGVEPNGEGEGGFGVGDGGYEVGDVHGGGFGVEFVDCVVEVGIDEEGEDISGEGHEVFGERGEGLLEGGVPGEGLFDGVFVVGYGGHSKRSR